MSKDEEKNEERRKEVYNEEGLKELLEEKKKDDQEWDKRIEDFEDKMIASQVSRPYDKV